MYLQSVILNHLCFILQLANAKKPIFSVQKSLKTCVFCLNQTAHHQIWMFFKCYDVQLDPLIITMYSRTSVARTPLGP